MKHFKIPTSKLGTPLPPCRAPSNVIQTIFSAPEILFPLLKDVLMKLILLDTIWLELYAVKMKHFVWSYVSENVS